MFDIFGNLFDINDDGSMDTAKRAAELGFVDEIIDDDEYEDDDDGYDGDENDYDVAGDEEDDFNEYEW